MSSRPEPLNLHGTTLTRRQFLALTTSGAASLWAAQSIPAAEPSPPAARGLRLSTSSIHFKDLTIEQACARIARLGFEAIDIWGAYDNCRHLDDALSRLDFDGLLQLLAKHRLKLCGFSTYVGGYPKYATLLGKAGGGVAVQGSAPPCKPELLTTQMRAFLDSLKPLVELAEKNNSYLAIENHGQALLDSLDSFKAFVEANTSPRLGIALAPYHLQAADASVTDAIRIAGRQLFFFYAWQNQPGLGQLPGHGPTDFRPWLQELAASNYRGYVNPFMHGPPEPELMSTALAKARDYLKNLV